MRSSPSMEGLAMEGLAMEGLAEELMKALNVPSKRGGRPAFSKDSIVKAIKECLGPLDMPSKSLTATKRGMRPVHPGEVLMEEFLEPFEMSASRLAHALGVPVNRITSIVNEDRDVTPETALLLSAYFGTSALFWLNLQIAYDLQVAERDDAFMAAVASVASVAMRGDLPAGRAK